MLFLQPRASDSVTFTIEEYIRLFFKVTFFRADVKLSIDQNVARLYPDTVYITPDQSSVNGQSQKARDGRVEKDLFVCGNIS